jgi:hypothetical protein
LQAKIMADPKDVTASIEKWPYDGQRADELDLAQKRIDESMREVERLKKEMKTARAGRWKQDRSKRAVNGLGATH